MTWFQNLLWNYSVTGVTEKQNRRVQKKSTNIWFNLSWQRCLGTSMGKESSFQHIMLEQGNICMQNSYITLYTKINSEWIANLNVTYKIMKLLDENKRKIALWLELGKPFLHIALISTNWKRKKKLIKFQN